MSFRRQLTVIRQLQGERGVTNVKPFRKKKKTGNEQMDEVGMIGTEYTNQRTGKWIT